MTDPSLSPSSPDTDDLDAIPEDRSPQARARRLIADNLEHTYGAALVAIVFFLALQRDETLEILLSDALSFAGGAEGASWLDAYLPFLRWAIVGIVPIAVYSAGRIAVMGTAYDNGWPATRMPTLYAAVTWAAVPVGLWLALNLSGRCFGDAATERLSCRDASIYFALSVVVYSLPLLISMIVTRVVFRSAGDASTRKRVFTRSGYVLAGIFLILYFFLIWQAFEAPEDARRLGPITVSALVFAFVAHLFAFLTRLSKTMPGEVPLVLVFIWLILSSTSARVALFPLIAIPAFVLFRYLRRNFGPKEKRPTSPTLTPRGAIAGLAVMAVSFFMWGEHRRHEACETLAGCNQTAGVPLPPEVEIPDDPRAAFAEWDGADAPVIRVVAAQGGGLYAAYHTAYYLAARADEEGDAFTNSVFAISGVSGGSVGAGVFWAIVKSGLCAEASADEACHRNAVREILREDYLTPVLATFYTSDAVDSVVPLSPRSDVPIDRGRDLERLVVSGIEDWAASTAPDGAVPEIGMEGPLAATWTPDAGLPLLMFNTTEVHTGRLAVFSPVRRLRDASTLPARLQLANGNDLTVASAMVASARFPIVSPPLRVKILDDDETAVHQFADGGYFDNSGIDTIYEIVSRIRKDRTDPIQIILLEVEESDPEAEMAGLVGAPVSAFFGAWRERRDLTRARLFEYLRDVGADTTIAVCPVRLEESVDVATNFTVSWYLAETTFDYIEDQIETHAPPNSLCE